MDNNEPNQKEPKQSKKWRLLLKEGKAVPVTRTDSEGRVTLLGFKRKTHSGKFNEEWILPKPVLLKQAYNPKEGA